MSRDIVFDKWHVFIETRSSGNHFRFAIPIEQLDEQFEKWLVWATCRYGVRWTMLGDTITITMAIRISTRVECWRNIRSMLLLFANNTKSCLWFIVNVETYLTHSWKVIWIAFDTLQNWLDKAVRVRPLGISSISNPSQLPVFHEFSTSWTVFPFNYLQIQNCSYFGANQKVLNSGKTTYFQFNVRLFTWQQISLIMPVHSHEVETVRTVLTPTRVNE